MRRSHMGRYSPQSVPMLRSAGSCAACRKPIVAPCIAIDTSDRGNPKSGLMSRLHADIALLFAAAVWGVAFLFQKSAMDHIGPLAFIAARGAVAALALAPLALREHRGCEMRRRRGLLDDRDLRAEWHSSSPPGCSRRASGPPRSPTPASSPRSTSSSRPFVAWGWSGKVPNPSRVAGGGPVGGRHLAARRRHARRLLRTATSWWRLSAFFWAIHVVVTGRASPYRRPIAFTAVQFAVVAVLAAVGAALLETTTLGRAARMPPSTSPTSGCCRARSPSPS